MESLSEVINIVVGGKEYKEIIFILRSQRGVDKAHERTMEIQNYEGPIFLRMLVFPYRDLLEAANNVLDQFSSNEAITDHLFHVCLDLEWGGFTEATKEFLERNSHVIDELSLEAGRNDGAVFQHVGPSIIVPVVAKLSNLQSLEFCVSSTLTAAFLRGLADLGNTVTFRLRRCALYWIDHEGIQDFLQSPCCSELEEIKMLTKTQPPFQAVISGLRFSSAQLKRLELIVLIPTTERLLLPSLLDLQATSTLQDLSLDFWGDSQGDPDATFSGGPDRVESIIGAISHLGGLHKVQVTELFRDLDESDVDQLFASFMNALQGKRIKTLKLCEAHESATNWGEQLSLGLSGLPSLRELEIHDPSLNRKSMVHLFGSGGQQISLVTVLTKLNLTVTRDQAGALRALTSALLSSPHQVSIQDFAIDVSDYRNNSDQEEVTALCEAIAACPSFQSFELDAFGFIPEYSCILLSQSLTKIAFPSYRGRMADFNQFLDKMALNATLQVFEYGKRGVDPLLQRQVQSLLERNFSIMDKAKAILEKANKDGDDDEDAIVPALILAVAIDAGDDPGLLPEQRATISFHVLRNKPNVIGKLA